MGELIPLFEAGAELEVIGDFFSQDLGDFLGIGKMQPNAITSASVSTPSNTIVRVLLGSDTTTASSFGGNAPGVSLWDLNGNPIGHTDGSSTIEPQGTFVDIEVAPDPKIGNVQSSYISITNGGNDAVCISGFTVTFPDSGKAGFDASAVAQRCDDVPWSNAQNPKIDATANDGSAQARCIWIDRDDSNGFKFQGFAVHLASFATKAKGLASEYLNNTAFMCKSGPRFRMYEQLDTEDKIIYFDPPIRFLTEADTSDQNLIGSDKDPSIIINNPGKATQDKPKKRCVRSTGEQSDCGSEESSPSVPVRHRSSGVQRWSRIRKESPIYAPPLNSTSQNSTTPKTPMYETVVISPHAYNSARALCNSEFSRGTSFVSLVENLFCDMEDKFLYHTCQSEAAPSSTSCCYNTSNNSLLPCDKQLPGVAQNSSSMYVHTPLNFVAGVGKQGSASVGMQNGKTFADVHRW